MEAKTYPKNPPKKTQAASDESQQHAFKNRAAALHEVPGEWVHGQGAAEALFKQKVNINGWGSCSSSCSLTCCPDNAVALQAGWF